MTTKLYQFAPYAWKDTSCTKTLYQYRSASDFSDRYVFDDTEDVELTKSCWTSNLEFLKERYDIELSDFSGPLEEYGSSLGKPGLTVEGLIDLHKSSEETITDVARVALNWASIIEKQNIQIMNERTEIYYQELLEELSRFGG